MDGRWLSMLSLSFVFYGESLNEAVGIAEKLHDLDVNVQSSAEFDLQGIYDISVFHILQNQTALHLLGPLYNFPTLNPTFAPTFVPTLNPTFAPTFALTLSPTHSPTMGLFDFFST